MAALCSSLVVSKFKGIDLISSKFWKKVLILWLDYKNKDIMEKNPKLTSPIFNNSLITYKKKTLFNERCIQKNVIFIRDFVHNNELITLQEFSDIYGDTADTILVYNIIFNALQCHMSAILRESQEQGREHSTNLLFQDLICGSIGRKTFYNIIIPKDIESLKESWCEVYSIEKNDPNVWLMPFETKLLELQWKILHTIYPTGLLLKKMNIKDNDCCEFCGELDTLIHFFVNCSYVNQVWVQAENIISCFVGKKIVFTDKIKLIGITQNEGSFQKEQRIYINLINLIVKKAISNNYKQSKIGSIKLVFESQLAMRGF